jgi:hypothetical protein
MNHPHNRRASDRAAEILAPNGPAARALPWWPILGLPASLVMWAILKVL